MKKLLLGIFTIAAMTSCVKEQTVATPELKPIAFDNFVQHTKAAIDPSYNNGDNKLDAFYVWGFHTAPSGVVFDKELVSYDATADAWTYSNIAYWAPEKTYKFAALAPVNNDKIQVTMANGDYLSAEGVLGTVAFENVDGKVDLLYAEDEVITPTTIPSDPEKVALTFQHLLSKVKFTFTNGLPSVHNTMAISNVKMVVPAKGTVDLAIKPFVWNVTESETITLEFGKILDKADDDTLLASAGVGEIENELLTIPLATTQSVISTYTVEFDVTIYNGDQVANTIHKTATITGTTFEAGKCYNISAVLNADNLDLKPIEFTVTVEDWVDGGNIDFLN